MPAFLEAKLRREYPKDLSVVYKIMNSRGYMKGSKETAKGRAAQKKHDRDVKAGKAKD